MKNITGEYDCPHSGNAMCMVEEKYDSCEIVAEEGKIFITPCSKQSGLVRGYGTRPATFLSADAESALNDVAQYADNFRYEFRSGFINILIGKLKEEYLK